MPIITAYSGSISLRAGEELYSEPFYLYDKRVYGTTLGELFDNLVEASVIAAQVAHRWITSNRPSIDTFNKDYWQATVTLPDIIKCQELSPSDYLDHASTMRMRSLDEIVRHSIRTRDMRISFVEAYLRLSLVTHSEIPQFAARDIAGIYDLDAFTKTTNFGWTGVELDHILEIARRENRIGAHNAKMKYDSRLREFEEENKTLENRSKDEKTGRRKKKWRIF